MDSATRPFFGVGLILGAGIYVLISRAAGIVGDAVWINVAFSALIAVATAFSYAELSSIFTTAASTYTYVASARVSLKLFQEYFVVYCGVAVVLRALSELAAGVMAV